MAINLVMTATETKVDSDDAWDYRFDGSKIFLRDDENTKGEFVEVGKIVKFNAASGDDAASVTLTLDLPGSMSFTKTDFEYGG